MDGSSTFFTDEGIKAAFTVKKGVTPPSAAAGIDFGDSVALSEIVNKHMTLEARSGDIKAFEKDVMQDALTKARQLDGTAALPRRSPQPSASPLTAPAAKVPSDSEGRAWLRVGTRRAICRYWSRPVGKLA